MMFVESVICINNSYIEYILVILNFIFVVDNSLLFGFFVVLVWS